MKKNISKLFCALFMLGMNVYGVESQWNVYRSVPSSGNGQFNGQPFVNGPQNQGYGQQSAVLNGNGQKDTMMYDVQKINNAQYMLSQGVCVCSKEKISEMNIEELKELDITEDNIGYIFDSLLNLALDGDDYARRSIERLTSKDSQIDPTIINPTVSMWYDACKKAIHATLQGNKRGFNIFKYLTSDGCHIKSKKLGSYFLKCIMDIKENIEKNEQSKKKSPAYFLSFAILTHLTSPDCKVPPSQEAVDQLFREKVDLALNQVLAGSDAVMDTIKILTRKDCNIQPTIDMWRDACKKAIHATLEGNGIGLHIFKHLTSDACHIKSNATDSDIWGSMIKSEIAGSDFLEPIVNSTAKIAKSEHSNELKTLEHGLSFAILTYLTGQDCKVRPSQEAVDQLFREKADQYVEMKNGSFEPTYVIKYLTSNYCSVPPSQEAVDYFFGKLIDGYTQMKSSGLYVSERTTNLFRDAIIHLISNKCNRHPNQKTVRASIAALKQANLKRQSEYTNNLVCLSLNNNVDLDEIEKCGMHLTNTELGDLKGRFEEYLKNQDAVCNLIDTKLKTVNKSEKADIASRPQVKNRNLDPQDQFTV